MVLDYNYLVWWTLQTDPAVWVVPIPPLERNNYTVIEDSPPSQSDLSLWTVLVL